MKYSIIFFFSLLSLSLFSQSNNPNLAPTVSHIQIERGGLRYFLKAGADKTLPFSNGTTIIYRAIAAADLPDISATYLKHGTNTLTQNTTFNGLFDWKLGNTTRLDTIQYRGSRILFDATNGSEYIGDISLSDNIIASGSTSVIRLKGYTVATLPAGTIGDTAYVTDATLPTYLGVLTGGGSVVTPVFYNGTAWVSH